MSVSPEDWRPRGIENLEPAAWDALRASQSASVTAGPGAGKSEFLAQRAAYLLETGTCDACRRILAISFKTDAAKNLGDRVRLRVKPELARRFSSQTFDAFTKGLVDRFRTTIPELWRPTADYVIVYPPRRELIGFLTQTRLSAPLKWQADIEGWNLDKFQNQALGLYRLPIVAITPRNAAEFAVQRWWKSLIAGTDKSTLTFTALNRLAELILRSNPQIAAALRATYPYVFVDEFQDTTFAQFDFLKSAFAGHANVTAVGDDKQRIMAWAGARPDSFTKFEADFAAKPFELLFNFRSSPALVKIQQVVASRLDPKGRPAVSKANSEIEGDVAQIWVTANRAAEAGQIATWLAADMRARNKAPRDYVILVRQKADDYEEDLESAFTAVGLQLRNEARSLGKTTVQDVLSDQIVGVGLSVLRLGSVRRSPQAWARASEAIVGLRGKNPNDENACRAVERELKDFCDALRADMVAAPSKDAAADLTTRVFEFLGVDAIVQNYPNYATGELLAIMIEAFGLHLQHCAGAAGTWIECLDGFEGVHQLPLMTVHKSKGLEYDTILFVGLDDDAWWSYSKDNPEGMATFFVAMSRAKQRAIFCFCKSRGPRSKVADLYALLEEAGVPEITV